MKYADIIVDISLESLDRIFQYSVPEALSEQVHIGSQVMIPFGNGNRLIKGYVIGFSDETDYDPAKIKEIYSAPERAMAVESQMILLADWMSRYYGCTRARSLKTVMNVRSKIRGGTKRQYALAGTITDARSEVEKLASSARFQNRAKVLKALIDAAKANAVIDEKVLKQRYSATENILKTLVKNGFAKVVTAADYRNPYSHEIKSKQVLLTPAQMAVADAIDQDERSVQLLFGVTGSGKTEVYMELIERTINRGRQAIVLIPEIALTWQNIARFQGRFGDRVSVMHSQMSDGERYDQYIRAKNGEADIVIGPRSALFIPFKDPGLVIIDEAHDGAYKSDQTPKYHAVDVAIERMRLCHGKVLLGTATPSVRHYYQTQIGRYGLHKLPDRVGKSHLAKTAVVDLREELKARNYSVFSRLLQAEMTDRLAKKEQIMLFLNRRGYAGFISCRACGEAIRCPHCDVSLTLHKAGGNLLKCHYCGYQIPAPKTCPKCGSPYIGAFGLGTEKVAEMLQRLYPEAKILRADRDATAKKNAALDIFKQFANGEADILVGTQMIVKGHDFPNVTLVGILAADLSMFSGDYMASERTFQLLTQAVGRAGRGDKPGLALIQTYQPDQYAVKAAAAQDYESFYKQEMSFRRLLDYPPFGELMVVVLEHEDAVTVKEAAGLLAAAMRQEQGAMVMSPAEGFYARQKDQYRQVIYVRARQTKDLLACRLRAQKLMKEDGLFRTVNIQFDLDPMSLY